MKKILVAFLFAPLLSFAQQPINGAWRAEIKTHGGALPIHFEVNPANTNGELDIKIVNGSEKFSLGNSYFRADSLVLPLDLYDSELVFAVTKSTEMNGYFVKKRNGKTAYQLPIKANAGQADRFLNLQPATINVSGKWMADFFSDATNHSPGVGVFEQKGNQVTGTFLRTSGDYRFLQGNVSGDSLLLSYFDGSGVNMLRAKITGQQLTGRFSSGLSGIRTVEAKFDPAAALPDLKKLSFLKPGFDRINFTLPTTKGEQISLQDERFKNKVVVIELMGSWCPNCLDESRYLAPFYTKYKDKGVEVIGIAFENSADIAVAGPKINNFQKKIGISYPLLFAGTAEDKTIEKVLPMLSKMNGYPTTFIIDKKGIVREIHTGFSGPGTGKYYADWISDFEHTIQSLLAEK
ncbi:TlpA disulfide reductase family protein [Aquirufa sp. HETE-83D]|uniref:TlpA disulfide reductase family protein n=1 Tax=Aquirufa esocilacus TaxID=3096513 RepID=A0ABW6DMU8_9BACT